VRIPSSSLIYLNAKRAKHDLKKKRYADIASTSSLLAFLTSGSTSSPLVISMLRGLIFASLLLAHNTPYKTSAQQNATNNTVDVFFILRNRLMHDSVSFKKEKRKRSTFQSLQFT
jgi:hypothetical protein